MGPDLGHGVWWILLVAFLTTGSTNAQNTADCGGELTHQSGVVTSPGYPDNYPNDQRCAWTLRARHEENIDIRFSRLDLEGIESNVAWANDTCPDYVRVYDGDSASSPLLATMCRIKNQTELAKIIIRSTSNVLYMVFVSDYKGQRPGFVASYWTHECPEFTYGTETCTNTCTCNREHTASCVSTSGECICKKGWTSSDCSQDVNECVNLKVEPCPFDYMECANNQGSFDCVCKAGLVKNANGKCEVSPGAVCNQGNGCSHVCVKISGQEQCYCPDNMKLVGKTCQACSNVAFGKDCRLSCNCTQNNTKSCDITTGRCICSEGWTLDDCSKDIDECTQLLGSACPSSSDQCVNTLGGYECKGCSYTITGSSGVIQSIGYPKSLLVKIPCTWIITTSDSGMTISFSMSQLYIANFDTYRDTCTYGTLDVYDGSNSSYPLLGRYCGYYTNTGIIQSSGNTMFITYNSQLNPSYFSGTYSTSVYQVVRSTTTDPTGTITSPGFPVSYSYNVVYTWTITVAVGNVVTFSFSEFGLGECGKDFVDIYDGKHAGGRQLAHFCNSSLPKTVSSTGTSMHIIYSSVGSTSEKGFNGNYITDACWCSPHYTASCKSPTGPCVCVSGINGSYCDRDIDECLTDPCPAHSTCYNSHGSFACYCWNGTPVNVSGSCDDWNKKLYGPSGNIQSQGFPNRYPRYVNYMWQIFAKAKEVVTLRFSEFNVEGADKCSKDSVKIYDGVCSDNKLIGQYCGKNIPALLRSTKPEMCAKFQTDYYDNSVFTGFRGTYYVHECPLFTYGEEKCTNPCSCAFDTTRICDNTNGVCFCKPGWVGHGCSQDLDECRITTVCPKNSECFNEPGSFSCECNPGYCKDASGQCIECSLCSDEMKEKCSHLCDVDELTKKERCYCPQDFVLLSDDVTCVVSLYPHGSVAADNSPFVKTNGQAINVDNIVFSSPVPFGKGFQNNARILYYGAISFNKKYMINYPDLQEALAKKYSLLAPFWTEKRNIGIGDVFYHVYETCSSSIFMDPGSRITSSPKEQEVIERATRDIKQFYNLPDFKVSMVFVVTWKNVKTRGCEGNITNTFQAILVSGYIPTTEKSYLQVEERSYVIFIYNDGSGICKPGQPFQVGVVTESGVTPLAVDDKDNPQLSQMIGNTGYKGVFKFSVGKKHSESIMCQRYLCEHAELVASKHFRAEIDALYQCPCSLDKLGLQWQLLIDGVDRRCYSISAVAKRRLLGTNQRNRVCCYSWTPPKSNSWEDWHESWIAGSFIPTGHLLVSDPWPGSPSLGSSNPYKDAQENMQARTWCCENSPDEFCNRFNKVFGDPQCTLYPIYVPASALGDPSVTSFDGKEIFMNGWGEYILVQVPSKRFTLQARTQRVMIDEKLSNGTVFTAFAAQEGDSANVQVQLDTTGTSMVLLANGNDFTNKLYRDPTFTWSSASVIVMRINEGNRILVAVTFQCGVSFKVHVGVTSLEIDIEMDTSLTNLSIGLLGNNNGDINDDFLLPNGTILPNDLTERQIFEKFAKEYLVTVSTSVFTYEKGESCLDYQHPEFVPIFYDELSPDQLLKAKTFCGDDDDACIYDFTVTGSEEFAGNTREGKKVHEQTKNRFRNRAPKITLATETDNKNRWRVLQGRRNTALVKVKDADNDAVTIELLENYPGVVLDQNGTITYIPDLKNPISLYVRAKDSIGSYSSILIINIAVCPLCNNHGDCDPNATAAEFYEGRYQILKCSCFPAYTGEACESEFNACELSPCTQGQSCTDLTAAQQGDSSVGHTCGPCPVGTTNVDGSCEDINECIDTTICDHECLDTYGSYKCTCRPGYRLDLKDSRTCIDINECEERTSACEQVCRNTPGSYNCNCITGYTLRSDGTTCAIDANLSAKCQQCEQVCNVSNGQASCDCKLGFEIDKSNPTKCSDIDECSNGVSPCSQKCTNTRGRFVCSCYPGYKLDTDGVSCLECDSTHFGENCSSTCNCRGNGRCDRIMGCVCNDQWTGINCDKDVNECRRSQACANGQVCQNEPGSYNCACLDGYRLENGVCRDINECKEHAHKCDSSLEDCFNNEGSYTCLCKEGFKLNDATGICQDINECEQHNDGCEHLCENGQGSYRCVCHHGYRLAVDRHSCEKYKHVCNLTCSHGCSLDEGTPFCFCPRGYNQVGADSCQDIDECASLDSNPCGQKDSCNNTQGNYICSCDPGYRLENDGRSCVACSNGTWGVQCNNSCSCGKEAISCDPVTGCQCKPGCSGEHCTEVIDRCASGDLTCQANEECVISGCSSVCQCRKGFFWDNGQCQDENECRNKALHNCSQICTNTYGGFNCSCYAGYSYNKSSNTCIDVNECQQNPCSKTCVNTDGSYYCSCPSGQILKADGVTCDCPNGCEVVCSCVENNTEYCNKTTGKCHCKKGWTSENCSVDVDECLRNPCTNGRKCRNLNGSFECVCWNERQIGSDGTCKECNQTLTGKTGYITSPYYPDPYQSNTYCTWTITVNDSEAVIELSFIDYRVEGCPHDYVNLHNGVNHQASLLAQVCDNWRTTFISKTNSLHLAFITDFSDTDKGFLAFYTSHVPCKTKKCSHTCSRISATPLIEKCQCPEWMLLSQSNDSNCININACNSTITEPVGDIVSQNYPGSYPKSSNCRWTIQGSRNSTVQLSFYDFSLEYSNKCLYDFVKVYDGNSETAPLLGSFCGNNLPPGISSSGNFMLIVFKTDAAYNYPGFRARYTI